MAEDEEDSEEDDDDEDEDDEAAAAARAQVTDGEPPAPPCRITSLVGRCRGGSAGAPGAEGAGCPEPTGRCPSLDAGTGRPKEREEDTYSSVGGRVSGRAPGQGDPSWHCQVPGCPGALSPVPHLFPSTQCPHENGENRARARLAMPPPVLMPGLWGPAIPLTWFLLRQLLVQGEGGLLLLDEHAVDHDHLCRGAHPLRDREGRVRQAGPDRCQAWS